MGCGASKTTAAEGGAPVDPELRISGHAVEIPPGQPTGASDPDHTECDVSHVGGENLSKSDMPADVGSTTMADGERAASHKDETACGEPSATTEPKPSEETIVTMGTAANRRSQQLREPPNKPRGQLRTLRPPPSQPEPIIPETHLEVAPALSPDTAALEDVERAKANSAAANAAKAAALEMHEAELQKVEGNADMLKDFLSVGAAPEPEGYLPTEASNPPPASVPVGR